MAPAFPAGTDISEILGQLPEDQREHACHVGLYVGLLAEIMAGAHWALAGLGAERYREYGVAAFYHDLGKALIPREILSKAGVLNEEEFLIVRRHPLYALDLLQLVRSGYYTGIPKRLVPLVQAAAVYHHERWDGKGYPFGSKGTDIPLIARVTSVCDSYDAMTSSRSYRERHTHAYACAELEKNAGTQFDPALVELFLNHEKEFQKRAEKLTYAGK